MKWIYLGKVGKFTCVDDEDYEVLKNQLWGYSNRGYAVGNMIGRKSNYRSKPLHMHLIKSDTSIMVDHINRDKLDNRRRNLRLVDRKGNRNNWGDPYIQAFITDSERLQAELDRHYALLCHLEYKKSNLLKLSNMRKRKIIDSNGVVYGSVIEASEAINKSRANIQQCCVGKRRTCGGLAWSYLDVSI